MELIDRVMGERMRSVAVTGMAKNCGKTTALDTLILEATARNVRLGVTSAGRDGEKTDAVTGLPKPPIWVPTGTLVVTVQSTIDTSEASVQVLVDTGADTPVGRIVLGRVESAGKIEIIGGNRHELTRSAIDLMHGHGARLVLVDGAANRVFLAAPTLVDGVILATGAAVDASMDEVLTKTRYALEVWNLPRVKSEALLDVAGALVHGRGAAAVSHRWDIRYIDAPTALGHSEEVAALAAEPGTRAVIVQGALTDKVLDAIMVARRRKTEGLELIVPDPTCVLTGPRAFHRFLRRGGVISVLRPVRILAVTLNPTSPYWPGFDPAVFFERAAEELAPLPVFDVVMGASSVVHE